MIYYNADENHKVLMFTKSAQSAEDYHLTETCEDDGIEKAWDGSWYIKGYAPEKPHNKIILEQIKTLEDELTPRNIRSAFLGDEYAIAIIQNIEARITELRKQLED